MYIPADRSIAFQARPVVAIAGLPVHCPTRPTSYAPQSTGCIASSHRTSREHIPCSRWTGNSGRKQLLAWSKIECATAGKDAVAFSGNGTWELMLHCSRSRPVLVSSGFTENAKRGMHEPLIDNGLCLSGRETKSEAEH